MLLGGGLLAFGLSTDVIACESGTGGSCRVRQTLSADRTFPSATVRDVRVDRETGSKGAKYGVDVLVFDGGTTLRLRRIAPEQAEQAAQAIRRGLSSHSAFEVTLREPLFAPLFGIAFMVLAVLLAWSAVRGMGRFVIEVAASGSAVLVTRRILGVAVSSREVYPAGADRIDVEVGLIPDGWQSRGQLDPTGGRLAIVDRGGLRQYLSADLHPGEAVHLRAAVALASRLGFDAGPLEARLAALPWRETRMAMRLGYAWIGLTTGTLVGVAAIGGVGLALGVLHGTDGPEAWMFVPGGVAGAALAFHLTRRRPPL